MSMADLAENYHQPGIEDFLKGLPGAWDDSKLLDGTPGTMITNDTNSKVNTSIAADAHAVVARRKAEAWYVAGVTVTARDYQLSLDFLDDGEYTAEIFTDVSRFEFAVNKDTITVTKDDVLDLSLLDRGGFTVRLTKKGS